MKRNAMNYMAGQLLALELMLNHRAMEYQGRRSDKRECGSYYSP